MTQRFAALDGLRGVAAFVVVVFHVLCFFSPSVVPDITDDPAGIADTPLGILWNGPFAVSIFFVLSGFVLGGAADRRRNMILANLITRYLRLALPVLASVVLAWGLLIIWPTATAELQAMLDSPSPWLNYTLQGEIPPISAAIYNGLVGNFLRGGSGFNNVLWTMRFELLGSIAIFGLYWLTAGRTRLVVLVLSGFALILAPQMGFLAFFAFVLGALLYEAYKRGAFRNPNIHVGSFAFVLGILLGAPARGFAERLDFPIVSGMLAIGEPRGLFPVIAAGLVLYGVLSLRPVAAALSTPLVQWLGRISFSLYLVHVPLLYTLIAWLYLRAGWPPVMLAIGYMALALLVAHIFTITIDEPCLRVLKRLRAHLQPWELSSDVTYRLLRGRLDRR